MEQKHLDKDKNQKGNEDAPIKPDPKTLGKTDPQEDMQGPVSSLMQKGSKVMETKEEKKDATKRHDENM